MFSKVVSPSHSSIKCYSTKKSHVNVFKSVNKHFIVTTKIEEKNNSVFIDRHIVWYDVKKNIYRKKREVQSYECDDFCEVNDDIETYDEEFDFYNKTMGSALNNLVE